MHIPDGVLSTEVCLGTGVIAAGAVGYSLHRLRDSLADRTVPMTGMMAALIFAGQMVNFPIAAVGIPSVSGHLMGGVLATAVLGPWAGCVAVTLVLAVQCLLFADGGLLALGANVLNMAVVGSLGGYAVYAAGRRLFPQGAERTGTVVAAVIAAWVSVLAAAALFCLQLRLAVGPESYSFSNIFTLMVSFHAAIGVGEALITGAVLSFVLAQRPELIPALAQRSGYAVGFGRAAAAGLVCALAIAAFLAPFASEYPDGLEAVAERTAFAERATEARVFAFDDYSVPLPIRGWQEAPFWQKVSVSLAGLMGTVSVAAIALLMGRALKPAPAVVKSKHA